MKNELVNSSMEDFDFEERLTLLCLEKAFERVRINNYNNIYDREMFKDSFANNIKLCREAISEANID